MNPGSSNGYPDPAKRVEDGFSKTTNPEVEEKLRKAAAKLKALERKAARESRLAAMTPGGRFLHYSIVVFLIVGMLHAFLFICAIVGKFASPYLRWLVG